MTIYSYDDNDKEDMAEGGGMGRYLATQASQVSKENNDELLWSRLYHTPVTAEKLYLTKWYLTTFSDKVKMLDINENHEVELFNYTKAVSLFATKTWRIKTQISSCN